MFAKQHLCWGERKEKFKKVKGGGGDVRTESCWLLIFNLG